jgi:hypothetical protein
MQVPESFDTLVVSIGSERADVRHVYVEGDDARLEWLKLGETTKATDAACVPHEGDTLATNLALPTTLSLLSQREAKSETTLSVVACKAGAPLFTTTIPITLPAEGDIQMLRVPIRWLCAERGKGSALGCFGCDSTRCYGREVHAEDAADLPCSVPACDTATRAYPILDYASEETARYGRGTKAECFDVLGCFGTESELETKNPRSASLAVDWETRPTGNQAPTSRCVATFDGTTIESSKLNLALVLPPGTQGHCAGSSCLVVLEADSELGWRVDDDHPERLLLPDAVCRMLDSGQILAVRASTECAAKTEDIPPCNPDATAANRASSEDSTDAQPDLAPLLRYELDESGDAVSAFEDKAGGFDMAPMAVDSQETLGSEVDGIVGTARAFDSHHYARSSGRITLHEDYAAALWLSLSETALASSSPGESIPVLSNLSSSCQTGFRLNLDRCSDGREIQIAFARAVGALPDGRCELEWSYAQLASTSYAGGFYTPWKRGDYRHVALSFSRADGPTFYVDGSPVTSQDVSCSTLHSLSTLHDDGYLYVGSNAERATALSPRSGPLLFDEVTVFNQTLSEDEARWLYGSQSTKPGPGGLHWGAWVTQGGRAAIQSATPEVVSATIDDVSYSSGGLFALLQREDANGVLVLGELADLRKFDEAVLWAKLPPNQPFQFALSADHGLRQCTWQLKSGEEPYYVINLRQPSWCVDPECSFDLSKVERASIASDWKNGEGPLPNFDVSALAFRKRMMAPEDVSPGTSDRVGGLPGPGGFCWRALSFFPEWLGRLTRYSSVGGIGLEVLRKSETVGNYTELAADLPTNRLSDRPRDFTQCPVVNVCMPEALPAQSLEFVLTNERGQTCSWPLSPATRENCYRAALNGFGALWPSATEATADFPKPNSPEDVAKTVVRIALRFAGDVRVQSVQCCDATGENCTEISDSVPRGSAQ